MKVAFQAVLGFQVIGLVGAACSQNQLERSYSFLPDLAPWHPQDLQLNGDEMQWSSRVTNMAEQGNFVYMDGTQIIQTPDKREICNSRAQLANEEFTVYTKQGTFVSQSYKEVSCFMDSEGGSDADSLFKGAGCADKVMGISSGGTDFYGSNTKGQKIMMKGWPQGDYYLVNRLKMGDILQSNTKNDMSYVLFRMEEQRGRKNVQVMEECKGWEDCDDRLNYAFGARQQQEEVYRPAPYQQQPRRQSQGSGHDKRQQQEAEYRPRQQQEAEYRPRQQQEAEYRPRQHREPRRSSSQGSGYQTHSKAQSNDDDRYSNNDDDRQWKSSVSY